ncbi:hypothetical protein BKE30_14030 [Alkanindiges hydrocarboniclasticus]|uniref:Toprim domain-containing protein n=1 Tax=Alkanindiges hydrocarboniclasticus TaxID=1907941 RepID=A0A1S8CQP7_9GAMM|nr:toprim domain-containing protein [Alkanindiges hydrocarboniclasticus]ONG37679.1 hypothetical protein BKE30_14030 [Alkanindiges hydrocarboniclasticus]
MNDFDPNEVAHQFLLACLNEKLVVDDVVMTGARVRCRVEGDKPGQKSGYYKAYGDGYPNGKICNYKTGGSVVIWRYQPTEQDKDKFFGNQRSMSVTQREQHQKQLEKLRLESEERAQKKAKESQAFLARKAHEAFAEFKATCVTATSHSYLEHKQANAYGIYIASRTLKIVKELEKDPSKIHQYLPNGSLVIPAYNLTGEFQSFQFISEAKQKGAPELILSWHGFTYNKEQKTINEYLIRQIQQRKFIKSFRSEAPKSGSVFILGEGIAQAEVILLCEGYATGATLHHCTGQTTLVCFDIENLCVIARQLRALYPHKTIYICSDNDHLKPRELDHQGKPKINVGLTRGLAASHEINSLAIMPIFPFDTYGSDWNDLYALYGANAVKEQYHLQISFYKKEKCSIFENENRLRLLINYLQSHYPVVFMRVQAQQLQNA